MRDCGDNNLDQGVNKNNQSLTKKCDLNVDQNKTLTIRDKNRNRKAAWRANLSQQKIQTIQINDRLRKQAERQNLTEEHKAAVQHNDQLRKQAKRQNLTEQQTAAVQHSDRKRKNNKRKTLSEDDLIDLRETQRHQQEDHRKNLSEQQTAAVQHSDRKRKNNKRKTLSEDDLIDLRATQRHQQEDHRKNLSEQQTAVAQETDRLRKRNKRICETSDFDAAINTFRQMIKIGPSYICTVCNRLMYKEDVVQFKLTNFSKCDDNLLTKCNTEKKSIDDEQYICKTCSWNLKRNILPPQAVANSLQLDEIPEQLSDLSTLESMLISKRIPFMKILALPRGKQKAIHGCVVNVPINPEETCSILPHVPSSTSCITVKLKRKLEYRGHVILQSVRPWKIMEALEHLKLHQNNPHYKDIVINENWQDESFTDDPQLWEALTANNTSDNGTIHLVPSTTENSEEDEETTNDTTERTNTSNENDNSDDEDDSNEVEDRSEITGLPYDSCLQPKDLSADKDFLLNLAPGEGKKPVGMFTDKNSEEMAFPCLFPSGLRGFDHQREKKISVKKYFNQRILNFDTRFAASTEYLFYAQYRCESKEVSDCLSIALRKCKGQYQQQKITAGQIKNVEEMRKLTRTDLSYHFLQNVRGSPAFFNKMLYDLLGMIRQLGTCTWFLTLSSADMKWSDTIQVIAAQHGVKLSDQQVENLTWEQKSTWLRSNPVTAARHFDHRLQLFLSKLVFGKSKPIGEVLDYKYRIEFQQRGSPHCHMLIWIKDAPSISENTPEEVTSFIDQYISCTLPEDDDELCTLVKTLQTHRHSETCKKHGTNCRFCFPKPPINETTVLLPPEEPPDKNTQAMYTEILTAVYSKLEEVHNDEDVTLHSMLEELKIPESMYIKALTWIKTKQGQPAILYKRNTSDVFTNNYNATLMKAWQANLDLQFVTNVYACIMYVASYISKPEKTLGDVLKSISRNSTPLGPKKMMETVSKKFLSHREVSAQEAVYRLLSLPLAKGSRQVIFIPTDLAENRTKLLKPMKVIQELDDDDEDLYHEGILEKYRLRPDSLEHICLADFAAYYTYSRKKLDDTEQDEHSDDEAQEFESQEPADQFEIDNLPKTIKLKTKATVMSKRTRPVIIRSHQFSVLKQPDQYYHAKLLLYLPWRDENKDLQGTDGDYKIKYFDVKPQITARMHFYEPNMEEYSQAVQDLEENGPPEDGWATLAPQTVQQEHDDRSEGARDDPEFEALAPNVDNGPAELGLVPHEYELNSRKITPKQWLEMTVSLNKEQRQIHQFIVQWCTEMSMTYKTSFRPKPFHIFISGGAGTGKSHLVRTIVQTVQNILNIGQNKDDIVVMVCAYTGVAAFNIEGHTLHSAFNLPTEESKKDDYIRLSNQQLAQMRSKLGNLCLLMIDEISMVGADHLFIIHKRLCEIMTSDEPFGSVSVLAIGDLSQLAPVGQIPVFEKTSDPIASLYGSLWKRNFQLLELNTIMRQRDDKQFAECLNRIRESKHDDSDVLMIKSREIDQRSDLYPQKALHIFAFNRDVDSHNALMLKSLVGPVITIHAVDSKKDQETGRIETSAFDEQKKQKKPGGMLKELKVAVGARVVMTSNVNTADGLVNGASGTITGFIPPPPAQSDYNFDHYKPKYILVHFDEQRVGEQLREKLKRLVPDGISTPVAVHEVNLKRRKVSSKRLQFPLALAWAVTIHKAQGRTVDQLVVSTEGTFKAGQMYTALSRVKTIDGLFVLGEFTSSKIKCDSRTVKEMARMKKDNIFKLNIPITVEIPSDTFFKLSLLNIRSLQAHLSCLSADEYIKTSDLIVLTETWLRPQILSSTLPFSDNHELFREDYYIPNTRPQGGVATYVGQSFCVKSKMKNESVNLQYQCLLLSYRQNPRKRMLIVELYIPPSTNTDDFFENFEKLLLTIPSDSVPTIICGDFNTNLLSNDPKVSTLLQLMKYHGFTQLLSRPTHRKGSLLDHIYINRNLNESEMVSINPVHYSDHFHVHLAIPWKKLLTFAYEKENYEEF